MLAASEYTFVGCRVCRDTAPLFLSYKMIARDLLGCSGRVGVGAVFEHFSGFEFFLLPNRVHAHLSASQRKPLGAETHHDVKVIGEIWEIKK